MRDNGGFHQGRVGRSTQAQGAGSGRRLRAQAQDASSRLNQQGLLMDWTWSVRGGKESGREFLGQQWCRLLQQGNLGMCGSGSGHHHVWEMASMMASVVTPGSSGWENSRFPLYGPPR